MSVSGSGGCRQGQNQNELEAGLLVLKIIAIFGLFLSLELLLSGYKEKRVGDYR